ncbi:MAG: 16S rRNA processing protein RimM [Bacilli bacterium]|nr:16S rRNA processing protein RimM [Bacilli bacterium]
MDLVKVGKIVNTHGIKGEIRILSSFPFKDKVFKINNYLIIDDKKYKIMTYRVHKNFDMVTLEGYNDINEVLFLMKKDVYVEKSSLSLEDDEVLDEDLIDYTVLTKDGRSGTIKEIFYASETNKILRVMLDEEVLIPYYSPMVVEINKKDRTITIDVVKGL